jgi:HK97 gp10 family phage protein
MGVIWHGPEVQRQIEAAMKRNLGAAVRIVANRAKVLLSVSGTGRNRTQAGASAPGEPPRKQTGRLRASVATEVDGLTGRVGTNVEYGRYLELGTRRMAARPWLRRALAESRAQVEMALARRPPGL